MPRKASSEIGGLDKLTHWTQHVKRASKKFTIVAQNKKCRDVLRSIGCKNVVYPLEPVEDFVDMIAGYGRPAVLLFDGDRPSNAKYMKLKSLLQQHGVAINSGFRKIIFTQKSRSFAGLLKNLRFVAGSERVYKGV